MKTLKRTIAIVCASVGMQAMCVAQGDSARVAKTDSVKTETRKTGAYTAVNSKVQISLFPYVGYNWCDSAGANMSIHATVGATHWMKGFSVAGIMNVVRDSAEGIQVAGIGNTVGGKMQGAQLAGIFNTAKETKGIQASCVFNGSEYVDGVQLNGLVNLSDSIKGIAASGFVNLSGAMDGIQVAGFANVARQTKGAAIAGYINASNGVRGVQISGGLNIADSVNGAQIGVVNVADSVAGWQFGLINIADTVSGFQLGLINICRKARFHHFELSADEIFQTNLALRFGGRGLHLIGFVGLRPNNFADIDSPLWTTGFGLGSNFGKGKRITYDVNLTAQRIFRGSQYYETSYGHHHRHVEFEHKNNVQLYKLYAGLDYRLGSWGSLAAGVTYNVLLTDNEKEPVNMVVPYTISNSDVTGRYNLKSWVGAKVALRFL